MRYQKTTVVAKAAMIYVQCAASIFAILLLSVKVAANKELNHISMNYCCVAESSVFNHGTDPNLFP